MKVANPDFYKKRTINEIKARTQVLLEAGIQRVFLASGWMGYKVPKFYYDCIHSIKEDSNLEIYGLFGAIKRTSYGNLDFISETTRDSVEIGEEIENAMFYL